MIIGGLWRFCIKGVSGDPFFCLSMFPVSINPSWMNDLQIQNRFLKFEKKNWRVSYNSLTVLEHLLTHGPESVAEEFKSDKNVISQMRSFQYIDDTG